MTSLDQFESAFNRAAKTRFNYEVCPVRRVVLLTDTDAEATAREEAELKTYFRVLDETQPEPPVWTAVPGDAYRNGPELMDKLSELKPDLVVTYRLLKERSVDLPYSLGAHLDHLSQATPMPLLVVPRDTRPLNKDVGTHQVMVITNHMTGDDRIVNWGGTFTRPKGELILSHVEDDHAFERYMSVISKIPALDTATARKEILEQLLREPTEFMETARDAFKEARADLTVKIEARPGHRVTEYAELVQQHDVDLLVIEGKDESQAAMSGLAYSLAVELRNLPILIL